MLLGIIADDMTGATDIALMLARNGMSTRQTIGVPQGALPDSDAVVVALKSRTCPVNEAVEQSLASLEALLQAGAQQILFKVCSTFDSTPQGNIGPVADALLARLGATSALVCPAFPANKRSVYQGHLFVGSELLSDSPMKDHPLTPMRDASLIRLMAAQSRHPVGLLNLAQVEEGAQAARAVLNSGSHTYYVADAVADRHLLVLGEALDGAPFLVGGSGIAMGLPDNFRRRGLLKASGAAAFSAPKGRAVILSGSCSTATRGQVADARARGIPALMIDPLALAEGQMSAEKLATWAMTQPADAPVLIYSTDEPASVLAVQEKLGRDAAGSIVEHALASTAAILRDEGFRRFVIAGGETSGAVVQGLGIALLDIGPEIDPGVPWTRAVGGTEVAITLKSGNFGTPDFFTKALAMLG